MFLKTAASLLGWFVRGRLIGILLVFQPLATLPHTTSADTVQGGVSLGASIEDVPPQRSRALGLTERQGALISDVLLGPALRAGLAPGEVVLAIDGHPVSGAGGFAARLETLAAGEQVNVTVHDGVAIREVALSLEPHSDAQRSLMGMTF